MASALTILDQSTGLAPISNRGGPAIVTTQTSAQSVTTGIAGLLKQVDVQIYKSTGTVNDVTLSLLPLVASVPDSTNPFFTTIIPISIVPIWDSVEDPQSQFTSVDVSSGGILLDVGDEFAIMLSRVGSGFPLWVIWQIDGSDVYAGGEHFIGGPAWRGTGPNDLRFQTFVDPVAIPEPGTVLLLSLSLVGLAKNRRRLN